MKRIFITFDIDWSPDKVIEYSANILKEYGITATYNVTHDTAVLNKLREEGHELGIHPNFNNLLSGNIGGGWKSYPEVIQCVKDIVPDAVTVRSHSLITGTPIKNIFEKKGLQYELNTLIEPRRGTVLFPYKIFSVWQIPFVFEDDIRCYMDNFQQSIEWLVEGDYKMFRVFNFHPIHVFLNTEHIDRYEKAKRYMKEFDNLKKYVNTDTSNGVENFLRDMIEYALDRGYQFDTVCNLGNALDNMK